ncbi:choline transporter protein 1-like [Tropilaelaps mercedesae]|uniref:Choline transporter-like protein n=1 Tax=Tropilaelaps mercedesae TaxID=418985 RepID=A0A1V9XVC1_9ACAR|nr:choline transporter protein 1-like [Tropilaelaps mercedesae]
MVRADAVLLPSVKLRVRKRFTPKPVRNFASIGRPAPLRLVADGQVTDFLSRWIRAGYIARRGMGCCGDTRIHSADGGKRTPDVLAEGLSRDRSCTNMTWIVILILYTSLMSFTSIEALRYGNPWKFIYGTNANGDVCGMRNQRSGSDLTSKPFLDTDARTCVTSCPAGYVVSRLHRCIRDEAYFRNRSELGGSPLPGLQPLIGLRSAAVPHADSETAQTSSVGRKTAMYSSAILPDKQAKQVERFLENVVQDISLCRLQLLYMALIAFGCSAVVILLLRFFTSLIVWFFLLMITALLAGSTTFLWLQYDRKQRRNEPTGLFYYGAIAATVVTALYLLILLVLRKRIHLTATLFQEAGHALSALPALFLQPLWTLMVSVGFSALWLYSFMFVVAAAADVQHQEQAAGYDRILNRIVYTSNRNYDQHLANVFLCGPWLHLLGFFWWTRFFLACQHFIIAGSVASWYFSRNKSALRWPTFRATGVLVAYHLGSIVLGSLLTSLLRLLRIVLAVVNRCAAHDRCTHACTVCCSCCLAIFERFLKYINRNAYILISIHGYPFCEAAHEAFGLLSSNILRLSAINSVGDFILFLGKVAVVAASVIAGLKIQQTGEMQELDVSYHWVPIAIGGVFAWLIADYFLSVYEMVIDTVFLCFCEDTRLFDGITQPYFMSASLMTFVNKGRRKMKRKISTGSAITVIMPIPK